MGSPRLVDLSRGVYTVAEVCLILGETMTSRRVYYWLDTGLISGEPVTKGAKGVPTLLTFRQLLEIKTVQHLRDEIKVPLSSVRSAYQWILDHVFEQQLAVNFTRGVGGAIIAQTPDGENTEIPSGQGAFPAVESLTEEIAEARQAWLDKRLLITPNVVADTRVLAGTPTVVGTRIETAFIAALAEDGTYDDSVIDDILVRYRQLSPQAVVEAFEFEGIIRAA